VGIGVPTQNGSDSNSILKAMCSIIVGFKMFFFIIIITSSVASLFLFIRRNNVSSTNLN